MLTNNLQVLADLGDASDSDVDPLGGVHRGAGHGQGHGVQRHPATRHEDNAELTPSLADVPAK